MARFSGFLSALRGPRSDMQAAGRVKTYALACMAGREISLAVNEIACNDPSCPGVETVILVMETGRKTWAVKIPKAVEAVTEEDVRGRLLRPRDDSAPS